MFEVLKRIQKQLWAHPYQVGNHEKKNQLFIFLVWSQRTEKPFLIFVKTLFEWEFMV
jgi:hypothetical protein